MTREEALLRAKSMQGAMSVFPPTSKLRTELIADVFLAVESETEARTRSRDRERLDWLESIGFSTVNGGRGEGPVDSPGVHSWKDSITARWRWTAKWISSEYRSCREAIDAAMERCGAKR